MTGSHERVEPARSGGLLTLGLPLRSVRAAVLATLTLLGVYALTMARDLSLFDSPELALVAVQLGLGHPTGQPLHTLLGFVFSHIPGLPPLVGLNLLSALAGALSVIPAMSVAENLRDAGSRPNWLVPAIAVAAGLHPALWEPATRVEVYTLAALCALWAIARVAACTSSSDFVWAGLALGLGACANPYVSLFAALGLAPGVLRALGRRRLPLRILPLGCAGGLLGLLPYLYVPWVASRRGVMVWGAPTDSESLRRYFLGLDYARSRGIGWSQWLAQVGDWIGWASERGLFLMLLLGLLGYLVAVRRSFLLASAALGCTILSILLVASNAVWQPDIPDYLGYLTVSIWLAVAGMVSLLMRLRAAVRPAITLSLALVIIGWCLGAEPALWTRTRHLDQVARVLAQSALREAPPRALAIVESDHWAGPMMYLQRAEHVRKDVVVLAFGLASSSWFWEQTFDFHPGLHRAALKGPGGRVGRVRRILEANPRRPVLVQDLQLASRLGLGACVEGWLRTTRDSCPQPGAEVDRRIGRLVSRLGEGAPSALGALSNVSLTRGLDLWRQGLAEAADASLRAAVPPGWLPTLSPLRPPSGTELAPPPPISWQRPVPLGEPAQNLFVASMLRLQLGDTRAASSLAVAAAQAGLPEAQRLLQSLP